MSQVSKGQIRLQISGDIIQFLLSLLCNMIFCIVSSLMYCLRQVLIMFFNLLMILYTSRTGQFINQVMFMDNIVG